MMICYVKVLEMILVLLFTGEMDVTVVVAGVVVEEEVDLGAIR